MDWCSSGHVPLLTSSAGAVDDVITRCSCWRHQQVLLMTSSVTSSLTPGRKWMWLSHLGDSPVAQMEQKKGDWLLFVKQMPDNSRGNVATRSRYLWCLYDNSAAESRQWRDSENRPAFDRITGHSIAAPFQLAVVSGLVFFCTSRYFMFIGIVIKCAWNPLGRLVLCNQTVVRFELLSSRNCL